MNGKAFEFWNSRSLAARVGLVAAALAVVVLAVVAAVWVLRSDYQPLFTELDPRDASAITAELDRMKVPYVIGEDGATILVDRSAVHATRLKIMGKGLDLKGTVGFEIFNNTDFGMTEFAQKINYQRALQGELSRTIAAFEEVKSARVHLVLPESGLLRRNAVKPKASVSLVMRAAQRLNPEQIQGIQRLVAASVPEMEPAAVTVLDQQGVALSRRADAEGGESEAAGARLEAKREIETYLARKVVAVLDQAFGPGKAIVSVDVSLSHDTVKVTREDVVPAGVMRDGLLARRKETTQRGAVSAAQLASTVDPQEMPRAPTATTSEVEYQHGRKVEQIVSTPGSIRRISVGVLLPGSIEPQQADGLKQVIAMAVGLNPVRGDGIAFSWVGRGAEAGPGRRSGGASGMELKPEASLRQSPRAVELRPEIVWFAAAILLLLAAFALVLLRRRRVRRADGGPTLTPQEREEMLARLKSWLGGGPRPGAQG